MLPQAPYRWYLTGFLVPTDADEEQRFDPNSDDGMVQAPAVAGVEKNENPEKPAARRSYLPSSLGLSVLIPKETRELQAIIRFGEYLRLEHDEGSVQGTPIQWRRNPQEEIVSVALGSKLPAQGVDGVPGSRGVEIVWSLRGVPDGDADGGLPKTSRKRLPFIAAAGHLWHAVASDAFPDNCRAPQPSPRSPHANKHYPELSNRSGGQIEPPDYREVIPPHNSTSGHATIGSA